MIRYPDDGILRPDNNLALCPGFRNPQDPGRSSERRVIQPIVA
jgi:hypothetical protein